MQETRSNRKRPSSEEDHLPDLAEGAGVEAIEVGAARQAGGVEGDVVPAGGLFGIDQYSDPPTGSVEHRESGVSLHR